MMDSFISIQYRHLDKSYNLLKLKSTKKEQVYLSLTQLELEKYIAESTLIISTPGTLVASGYCWMFLQTVVLGIFPRIAVRGLVTCNRIFAKDIETYRKIIQVNNTTNQKPHYHHRAQDNCALDSWYLLQLKVLSQPRQKQPQKMLPCKQQSQIYQSSISKLLPYSPQG